MKEYVLNIAGHSATLKTESTGSKDTGIFFPPELIDFLGGMENLSFIVYKDDCVSAMASIIASLPLYSNKGGTRISHISATEVFSSYTKAINTFFGDSEAAVYTDFQPSETTQARRYLYGLEKKDKGNFSIRNFLIANYSTLTFKVDDDKAIHLRIKTNVVSSHQGDLPTADAVADISEIPRTSSQDSSLKNLRVYQKIFFGAPGTGKSHKIDYNLFKDENGNLVRKGIKEIPDEYKFRTTFHPDYDYAQFVGSYKPKAIPNNRQNDEAQGGIVQKRTEITYDFVPQVFAKAYATAWKLYLSDNDVSCVGNQVYLVIEEINRGNCAQIFGDIFQLLDRHDGHSEYPIDIDSDFATWLRTDSKYGLDSVWDKYKKKIHEWSENKQDYCDCEDFCKIALPPNLNILATMNTSDQSLFPMDSAFKRRFDWEYVPIRYSAEKDKDGHKIDEKWNVDKFKVFIDENHSFEWLPFLKKVNEDILKVTESEDKQMGEFFIKPKQNDEIIRLDEFRSKVLFYLWDSVYKDDSDANRVFHFNLSENADTKVTFQSLFNSDERFLMIMEKMLTNLDKEYSEGDFKYFKILNESSWKKVDSAK